MSVSEEGERLVELALGDTVRFGANDEVGALHLLEEADEGGIRGLWGDIGVDKADGEGESFALGEVGFDESGPLAGDGFADFGVTVAW